MKAAAWEDATYLSIGFVFGCVLLAIICDAVSRWCNEKIPSRSFAIEEIGGAS